MMISDNNHQHYLSVPEMVRQSNQIENTGSSCSLPIQLRDEPQSSSLISSASPSTRTEYGSSVHDSMDEIIHGSIVLMGHHSDSRTKLAMPLQRSLENGHCSSQYNLLNPDGFGKEVTPSITQQNQSSAFSPNTGQDGKRPEEQLPTSGSLPLPTEAPKRRRKLDLLRSSKRSLPLGNFLKEIGALLVVFTLSMVLVLAIREDQLNLRITMQVVYIYIYSISTIWMIWCAYDIIKFSDKWTAMTSAAHHHAELTDIATSDPQTISYFPDVNNTGGLFMKFGAAFLCMGSLLLSIVELAETVEMLRSHPYTYEILFVSYSRPLFIAKAITFICRFVFHSVQFLFLFRYGNIVIDCHWIIAKIGLIHVVIANFCTWFEAIVIETLEELHKNPNAEHTTSAVLNVTHTLQIVTTSSMSDLRIGGGSSSGGSSLNSTTNVLNFIEKIESTLFVYLYPCLIEYSLMSVTVFYIMWRNVEPRKKPTHVNFGHRHVYTLNCSRASRGLLVGGIILLLTVITLIPDYVLSPASAIPITHITELVLLLIAFVVVCLAFSFTTKLYYDDDAHVNFFDQILILVTTVGDFAYSFFGLFAAIFIESYSINIPRAVEVTINLLAIFQTFVQSGFILDALRRRLITSKEIREKPGRELITALLLINLTLWMHDSLSAKKVKLNPLQVEFYNLVTWSIVQAFTSPLSIFYRFHSSVCLADIWQEVYHDTTHVGSHHRSTENTRHPPAH